jgi:hypothetical protein
MNLKAGWRQVKRPWPMAVWKASGVLPVCAPIISSRDWFYLLQGQKMYSKQAVYDAHLTSKKNVKSTSWHAMSDQPLVNPCHSPTLGRRFVIRVPTIVMMGYVSITMVRLLIITL